MGNKLAQPDRHTISSLTLQKGTKWRTNGVIDQNRKHKFIRKHM